MVIDSLALKEADALIKKHSKMINAVDNALKESRTVDIYTINLVAKYFSPISLPGINLRLKMSSLKPL